MQPQRWQPTRLPHPWDSPGKNTGVGCHFLLQYIKVKSESEVAQLCPTLSDPMDCSLPGSSVHGIFQARVLEWGATAFSVRDSSQFQLGWRIPWKFISKVYPQTKTCRDLTPQGGFEASMHPLGSFKRHEPPVWPERSSWFPVIFVPLYLSKLNWWRKDKPHGEHQSQGITNRKLEPASASWPQAVLWLETASRRQQHMKKITH